MFDIGAIIQKVRSALSRRDVFFILLLLSLFFVSRLYNLESLPIFTDEGIYIRWAKVAWHDGGQRFISLTDGRQPLQTWATIPFLKLFPDSLLLAGRLFGVFSGLGTLIGIFLLLWYLFGKKAAYIGSFIYIFNPYFLFYDRMALADSAVNAGFVWMLLFSILLVRTVRLDVALMYGLMSGFVLLTKSTPKLFLIASAFAPILIVQKDIKKTLWQSVNYYVLFGFVVILAALIYNVQRLSGLFHYVALKNTTFILTWQELVKNPFSLLGHNLWTLPYYVLSEMGWVIVFSALVGLAVLFRSDRRLATYLLLWFLIPYLAIGAISKVVFPRYLIFMGTSLLIFTTYFLQSLKNSKYLVISVLILIFSVAYFDYTILFSPKNIPFPEIDRGQYIEGITAGWGVRDIIDFARHKSVEKPVILLAEGNFGVIGDMLEASKRDSDKTIEVKGYWPLDDRSLAENQLLLKDHHIYIVFSHRQEFPPSWPMQLVEKYEKPGGQSPYHLFELTH